MDRPTAILLWFQSAAPRHRGNGVFENSLFAKRLACVGLPLELCDSDDDPAMLDRAARFLEEWAKSLRGE